MANFSSERVITDEIGINNCGIQTIDKGSNITVRRRADYTLMYLADGAATMSYGEKKYDIHAGEAMLFLPEAEQRYRFCKNTKSVNMWLHFGGAFCRALDGKAARVIKISDRNEFESAFERLVRSYNFFENERELLCNAYLRVIIALICRDERIQHEKKSVCNIRQCIGSVLSAVNMGVGYNFDWDEWASRCYMSRDRFNHVFREYSGYSPERYRIKVCMERAKFMLGDCGMSVSECAEKLGFHDVSYFCRRFRIEFGVSPGEYAKIEK